MYNKITLLTGSNIGDSANYLREAANLLNAEIGSIVNSSSVYETAAWGNTNQANFLNQVLVLETQLTASLAMQHILQIEEKMGRIRTEKNAPRIIDIDILFFADEVIDENWLKIPHPLIGARRFVLTPLNEIMPLYIHPVTQISIEEMLQHCNDDLIVIKK
jgi:2-amino-4-hydroxy-6-hydroxymethyldihydropteridine diphosphokinase